MAEPGNRPAEAGSGNGPAGEEVMDDTTSNIGLGVENYKEKWGWADEDAKPVFVPEKGLSPKVIDQISSVKNEPDWMRQFRQRSLEIFRRKPLPTWGGDLSGVDFEDMYYYSKPTERQGDSWEDIPPYIKDTFD